MPSGLMSRLKTVDGTDKVSEAAEALEMLVDVSIKNPKNVTIPNKLGRRAKGRSE